MHIYDAALAVMFEAGPDSNDPGVGMDLPRTVIYDRIRNRGFRAFMKTYRQNIASLGNALTQKLQQDGLVQRLGMPYGTGSKTGRFRIRDMKKASERYDQIRRSYAQQYSFPPLAWEESTEVRQQAAGHRPIVEGADSTPSIGKKTNGSSDEGATANIAHVRATGAGFGSAKENAKVEAAGITAVHAWYTDRGWKVNSVERDRCGFDLECRNGSVEENAEVKGVSGDRESCIITAAEVIQARNNPKSVVWVVTRALVGPKLHRYSGTEFIERFKLTPIQYIATVRMTEG
jgi:hypothetical protein